ncbi:unnamed protein product [Gongylonema pulchrum]|uniref:Glyco_hydro38C2 domain-containing protein n=1 Tax=Gongylonema pulchrum TaxID=637853 RepID=A0A183DDV5_9BILA|nr:unnamed protein product [Gongylonema pulchrum]
MEYRDFQTKVPVFQNHQLLIRYFKCWKENTLVLVAIPTVENAQRVVVRSLENDEYGNITLDIRTQINDTQILEEMQDANSLDIKPDCKYRIWVSYQSVQ